MKILIAFVFLLLTGCTSPEAQLEQTLNSYARSLEHPAVESAATKDLTGTALSAAEESSRVLKNLGLRQIGAAEFDVLEIFSDRAIACLDVSQTHFENLQGQKVSLGSRPEQLTIEIEYSTIGARTIISDMRLMEEGC